MNAEEEEPGVPRGHQNSAGKGWEREQRRGQMRCMKRLGSKKRGGQETASQSENTEMAAGPGTPGTPPPPQLKMNGRKRARTKAENTEDKGQQQAPPMRSHAARETSVFIPLFSTLLFLNPSKTQSSIFSTKMSLNSSSPFQETRISTLTQFHTSLGICRQNPELRPAIHRSKKLDPLGEKATFQPDSCSHPTVPQLGCTWALPPGSVLLQTSIPRLSACGR